MSEREVRVGFIGAGAICRQRHLPGLQALEGVRVVTVCNRSVESSQRIADEFGIESVETDWTAVINREDVDAVFIGSFPDTHSQYTCAALSAGKHVFCQSRMAATFEDARTMHATAQAHPELVTMLCIPPHRLPHEAEIRESMREERWGTPLEIRLECTNGSALGPLSFRHRVEQSGIQIGQVGIWAETLNAWFGDYIRLRADLATPIGWKRDSEGAPYRVQVPQVTLISGELASGVHVSEYHSDVASHEPRNQVTVNTETGTLRLRPGAAPEFAAHGEEFARVDVDTARQRDWQAEADFIGAVRLAMDGAPADERPVTPDFEEGMRYMRKMAAIHLSANSGRWVDLGDIDG